MKDEPEYEVEYEVKVEQTEEHSVMDVREIVFEALTNAYERWYSEVKNCVASVEADSLVKYCFGLEGCSSKELVPHIEAWKRSVSDEE